MITITNIEAFPIVFALVAVVAVVAAATILYTVVAGWVAEYRRYRAFVRSL